VTDALRELLLEHDELADLPTAERRLELRRLAVESGLAVAPSDLARLAEEIDGYGPVTELMDRDDVTDVLINGHEEVWVDRAGELTRTQLRFRDQESLRRFVARLLGRAGVRLDRSHPIADARAPDGSRVHAVLPPISPSGPVVSIRRFPQERLSLETLQRRGMFSPDDLERLRDSVAARKTIVVSGKTGTGKSTLLDALLGCVDDNERVVTIEELPELSPRCSHHVSLVTRGPNVDGLGAVDLDQLVRASLRMRPDRIVVGEVRGPEALTALDAMSTGHEGSMLTVHARSAAMVPSRLVTLALQARVGASERALERQVKEVIDLVVHLERDKDRRFVSEICALS
jgi:pilus assembly protein CpaF